MENPITKISVFLLCFIVVACSKSDTDENPPNVAEACIESSFKVTIDKDFKPVCIIEDTKSNILILGSEQGIIQVLKLDPYGNFLWQNTYDNIPGKPMSIVQTSSGYLITSGTMQFETTWLGPVAEIEVEIGYVLNASNQYVPYFQTKNNYLIPDLKPVNNNLYINQLNESGEFIHQSIWSKGNYCAGNLIQQMDTESLILSIVRLYGDRGEINLPIGNSVTFPRHQNHVDIVKINNEGEFISDNTINGVLIYEYISELQQDQVDFNMVVNGANFTLNLPNRTYFMDNQGNVLDMYQPKYNFTGNHTFSMVSANESANYFIGKVDFYDSIVSEYYIMLANLNGNPNWYKKIGNFDDGWLVSFDGGVFAMTRINNSYRIYKYGQNGELFWEKDIDQQPQCFTSTCKKGVIYIYHNPYSDQITITKTDSEGEY